MSELKRLLGESGMLPQGKILDPRGQPEVGPGAGGEKTQLTRGWRTRGAGECEDRTWDQCSHVSSPSRWLRGVTDAEESSDCICRRPESPSCDECEPELHPSRVRSPTEGGRSGTTFCSCPVVPVHWTELVALPNLSRAVRSTALEGQVPAPHIRDVHVGVD